MLTEIKDLPKINEKELIPNFDINENIFLEWKKNNLRLDNTARHPIKSKMIRKFPSDESITFFKKLYDMTGDSCWKTLFAKNPEEFIEQVIISYYENQCLERFDYNKLRNRIKKSLEEAIKNQKKCLQNK
jgi:hypothetical protein